MLLPDYNTQMGEYGIINTFSDMGGMPFKRKRGENMPYAVLEKEIERLDETQQKAVVMFVRFLLSQKPSMASVVTGRDVVPHGGDSRWNAFDRIRAKAAIDHKDHEWTMEEIDAEIAASRRERREQK